MHMIQELLEEAGYGPRAYSGRGMYGEYCLGVSSCHSESEILSTLISVLVADNSLDKQQLGDRINDLTESFAGPTRDSLGMDTIYYWPHIEYEASEEVEDDEL